MRKDLAALFVFFWSILMASQAQAVSNIQVHGYVDAQYRWDGANATTVGGLLDEAALIFSHEFDGGAFLIDLPFRGGQATGSSEFFFAKSFAQAYVGFNHGNGFRWRVGQWDSVFGYEPNDSNLIRFTSQGMLHSWVTPNTHAGVLFTYDFNERTGLSIYAGSPSNQGSLEGDEADYGAQLSHEGETFQAQLGYRTNQSTIGRNWLADVVLGLKLGTFDIHVQADVFQVTAASGTGYAALLAVGSDIGERWSWGVRGEYGQDIGGVSGNRLRVTAGPQVKINRDIRVKADYTFDQEDPSNGSTVQIHKGAIGAVYTF